MSDQEFTLEDFQRAMRQMQRLGSMQDIVGSFPGLRDLCSPESLAESDRHLRRLDGIISSMTPRERREPELLDPQRARRIATGSGVQPADVEQLVHDVLAMRGMMQQMAELGKRSSRSEDHTKSDTSSNGSTTEWWKHWRRNGGKSGDLN